MNNKETLEKLRNKISEHSNSMFPLIDFFNDIELNSNERFDKERAYEDIEKVIDVFIYYKDKCKHLEEENTELKQVVDILKETKVVVSHLLETKSFEEYNFPFKNFSTSFLTKEEYELLKEVFENVKRLQRENAKKNNLSRHYILANEKTRKKVSQYTKDNKLIKVFESISEASRHTGINIQSISCVCNKKRKTAGGYIWHFA